MKNPVILFFLCLIPILGTTQDLSNLRHKTLILAGDSIKIDSLNIIPNSFQLYDEGLTPVPDTLYHIDYITATLFYAESIAGEKVKASYRIFSADFIKPYYHKDPALIRDRTIKSSDPFRLTKEDLQFSGFYSESNLNKRGSISRGITLGSQQDVVINSNLNLQLSGKLSEDINIVAVISDNNIPIQPEGISQQIHEFDKVYIQLYNDKMNLTVGDFDMQESPGHFMRFIKKAKGVEYSGLFKPDKKNQSELSTTISGAISKGTFCRSSFMGQEGNQGPYKLRGCNNEQYIIVLAGTERIYIDGKLMTRGLDNDYIIDYNTAEITFTSNQPITKDKRIIVEFEYSERSYTRFLLYTSNSYKTQNGTYRLNIFSEQDDKNQTLQQDLSEDDKYFLSTIGDNVQQAIVPQIDSVGFNNNEILYKKIDTLVNGEFFQDVYEYSTNPDSAHYRLGFSFVGERNGNYMPAKTAANGKVYQWIAPENGIPQGSHEPIVLLITPKKKQVISLGGNNHWGGQTSGFYEFILTNNDFNTFSSKDHNDNLGYAIKLGIGHDFLKADTSRIRLQCRGIYQHINKHFDPIERFRPVEFERDWNLQQMNNQVNEHLYEVDLDFFEKNLGFSNYTFELINRQNLFQGIRNNLSGNLSLDGFELDFQGSLLNTKDVFNKTIFFRHNVIFSRHFKHFSVGVGEDSENNQWENLTVDSLLNNSFKYNQVEAFIRNPDTSLNHFFIIYRNRKDYTPQKNDLDLSSVGENMIIGMVTNAIPANRIKTTITYRNLKIPDTLLTDIRSDESLIGRLEHSLQIFKGVINTSTFLEVGSGLEAEKEFSYLEVVPGQGVYTWTDYNGNNVKELDEFEIAKFQDQANYIRIFTPVNDYITVYTNRLNQTVSIQPQRIWHNESGFRKLLVLFSDQLAYRIDRKSTVDNLLQNINPYGIDLDDPNLVTLATSIRNNLSINKTGQKFGLDYIIQKNKNHSFLAHGFDTRTLSTNGFRIRWNANQEITLINQSDAGNKSFTSEFFRSRNYHIHFLSNDLSFQYQPGLSFRIGLNYKTTFEENQLENEESAIQDLGLEMKYSILNKGNLSCRLNYIHIVFNADPNTPVAYEMLEGLHPGHNGTCHFFFRKVLHEGLN